MWLKNEVADSLNASPVLAYVVYSASHSSSLNLQENSFLKN